MAANEANKTAFALMVEESINSSELQQNELAAKLGYTNANIMTLFKKGMTRVPLDKVVPLATAVGGDPASWLRQWFEAYMPGSIEHLETYLGFQLTHAEKSWVKGLRKAFKNKVPLFDPKYLSVPETRP